MNIQQLPAQVKQRISEAKVPIEYDKALKALAECLTIDEAKYWDSAAEAAAAWARIHRSDRILVAAKRLKLHARRRIGQLAEELQPLVRDARGIYQKGPRDLMIKAGMSSHDAESSKVLAELTAEQFEYVVSIPRPPAPSSVRGIFAARPERWGSVCSAAQSLRSFVRSIKATELASEIAKEDATSARKLALELVEWLDEFERHLPK